MGETPFQANRCFFCECSIQITLSGKCSNSRLKLSISGNAKIVANAPAPAEDDATFKGVRKAKLLLLIIHLHFSEPFHLSMKMHSPSRVIQSAFGSKKSVRGHRENKTWA